MPTTTSIFSDEILKQADDLRKSEGQYETAFDHWARSVPSLSPKHFWPEVDRLRLIWEQEGHDSERAAEEYLRLAACEGEEKLAAAVHFAVSYRRYSESVRGACEHIVQGWDRGDDGFGDLMDSLPMAGEEVYTRVKSGEFFDEDEDEDDIVNIDDLEQCIRESVPKSGDQIVHGEHYWASTLERAAAERMKFVLLCSRR